MEERILRCDRGVIHQAKWRSICAISLTETIIFQIEAAIVVKSRAPQRRAMIHHAVIDVANDFAVAKTAGLLRHT